MNIRLENKYRNACNKLPMLTHINDNSNYEKLMLKRHKITNRY